MEQMESMRVDLAFLSNVCFKNFGKMLSKDPLQALCCITEIHQQTKIRILVEQKNLLCVLGRKVDSNSERANFLSKRANFLKAHSRN